MNILLMNSTGKPEDEYSIKSILQKIKYLLLL